MAVFTQVSFDEAAVFLGTLQLGPLQTMQPCEGGIENTNYFVSTAQGDYVLTLFERLTFAQLPFYLRLMQHLAGRDIPVPNPQANPAGEILHQFKGKPAAVVNKLPGRSQMQPAAAHCSAVGAMLARMHLAGRDFDLHQPNLRGLPWWNETVPLLLAHIKPAQQELLLDELAYQNQVAAQPVFQSLPQGPVHADLFRDNVMFATHNHPETPTNKDSAVTLTGFFDFYFAGWDCFLFDLSVCLNDWCIDAATGVDDPLRCSAMLAAYQTVRPLTDAEQRLLPAMRRAGALRFWVSRLWDFYLPRTASVLQPHDPTHFERVLCQQRLKMGAGP